MPNKRFLELAKRLGNKDLPKEKTPEKPKEKTQVIIPEVDVQNPQDYVLIPNTNIMIAKREVYHNLDWNDTHFKLSENGLFMPTPRLFMKYFTTINDAYNGLVIYDGAGNRISENEVEEIYKYLTTDFDKGSWTWLDSKFKKTGNNFKIHTDHRVVNGKLKGNVNPLEKCLMEDCYVDASLINSQGLPTEKTTNQSYKQGENMYFWYPRNNAVAGFWADSDRAFLFCYWDPDGSDSSLGVLACAAGVQKI